MSRRSRSKRSQPRAQPPRTNRDDVLDENDQQLVSIISSMLEVLACPVSIAEEHATRLRAIAHDVERFRDLAMFARKLYGHDRGPYVERLSPLLAEFAAMMERQARELSSFASRFEALDDHEIDHQHLAPEEIPFEELVTAMFGAPDDDESDDARPL